LKLCIFSRSFYPAFGGLERVAQILANKATEFGHKVVVVTDTPGVTDVDDQKFPFIIVRTREYRNRVQAFKQSDAILFMNVSLHGMLAAFVSGTPVVLSHHGIYIGHGLVSNFLELIKRQLTWFYPNISVSEFVAYNMPFASVVIPNAYDSAIFKQPIIPVRARDFVFCGRLVSDKGADVCVQAFFEVVKTVPDATLSIVGDGPEYQALFVLVQSHGVSGQIRFTGALTGHELVSELQSHACLVVPSLWEEPFGIVALEGIACCDTVIVSRRGGLPEAVGECGLIVDDMAKAMMVVVRSRRCGMQLPGQPSERVRQAHLALHTPEGVTKQYLNVVEQAIFRHKKRGIL
jgi:glycosyltransferase involved in cell wall biosynthesis